MNISQAVNKVNQELLGKYKEARESSRSDKNYSTTNTPQPFANDALQTERMKRREMRRQEGNHTRGAMPSIRIDMDAITDSNLPYQYKKAKSDSEYLKGIGKPAESSMVKQQYMEDYFLPAVDAMVRMNSMEAVLSNPQVLDALDHYTLLDGTRGNGYTKAYILSLYAPTGVVQKSDGRVRHAVMRIKALCEDDMIRTAVGIAQRIKGDIDSGKSSATNEDYELITRVALATPPSNMRAMNRVPMAL